jgi:hypothetical protein
VLHCYAPYIHSPNLTGAKGISPQSALAERLT